MSLSDCPECWDTPCTCGYGYRKWSVSKLDSHVNMLECVRAKRSRSMIRSKVRPGFYDGQTAKELHDAGYRQTSRRFGIVSRVDISDEEMTNLFIEENFGETDSSVPCLPIEEQRGHYRRCYSEDNIEGVPDHVLKELRRMF